MEAAPAHNSVGPGPLVNARDSEAALSSALCVYALAFRPHVQQGLEMRRYWYYLVCSSSGASGSIVLSAGLAARAWPESEAAVIQLEVENLPVKPAALRLKAAASPGLCRAASNFEANEDSEDNLNFKVQGPESSPGRPAPGALQSFGPYY